MHALNVRFELLLLGYAQALYAYMHPIVKTATVLDHASGSHGSLSYSRRQLNILQMTIGRIDWGTEVDGSDGRGRCSHIEIRYRTGTWQYHTQHLGSPRPQGPTR